MIFDTIVSMAKSKTCEQVKTKPLRTYMYWAHRNCEYIIGKVITSCRSFSLSVMKPCVNMKSVRMSVPGTERRWSIKHSWKYWKPFYLIGLGLTNLSCTSLFCLWLLYIEPKLGTLSFRRLTEITATSVSRLPSMG